ncbi:hypothetical protein IAI18_03210 [Acetobacteraceae bacterium H6797]|nr:hypothetical protein [Acetobacteraceae bacterium H6797]
MSSKAHPPPIPPANRAPQPGKPTQAQPVQQPDANKLRDKEGQSDNLAENTHHQGYQQDR